MGSLLLVSQEYEAHQNKVLAKLNRQQSSVRSGVHEGGASFDADSAIYRNNRRQLENLRIGGESVPSEDDATSVVSVWVSVSFLLASYPLKLPLSLWDRKAPGHSTRHFNSGII